MLYVSRVLNKDDDFVTLEVGRHDGVVFHLQQNEEGETVGGDEFLTLMFVRNDGSGKAVPYDPFE